MSRVLLRASLGCIVLLVVSNSCLATTIQITKNELYDTEKGFKWLFQWTGFETKGFEAVYTNPPIEWGGIKLFDGSLEPKMEIFFLYWADKCSFRVYGAHHDGPHDEIGDGLDIDPGDNFWLLVEDYPSLPVGPVKADTDLVDHLHHPEPDHWDTIAIFYSREGSEHRIQAVGAHIPEPATIALLGFGGIVLLRRRRGKTD